jgi:hypothetical protein
MQVFVVTYYFKNELVKTVRANDARTPIFVPRIGDNVCWSDNIGDCGKVYNVELHVFSNTAKVFLS